MELCRKGLYAPALKLITEKNPLPFLTGTICAHRCQTKCSRNFYDESVRIRDTKLLAAEKGYDALMASIRPTEKRLRQEGRHHRRRPHRHRRGLFPGPGRYRDHHLRAGELAWAACPGT